jgi:hypothetical protein
MTEIVFTPEFSFDGIVAFIAILAASYFAHRQIYIMDKQRRIFERQTEISGNQAFYQGQQTTTSQQQARLLNQQLDFIREQEKDRRKKEELFLLIAPLYTNFRKDEYNIVEWMSLREQTKIWMYRDYPAKEKALKILEADILEIMRQRKGLAQEPLSSKIDAFEGSLPHYRNNVQETEALLKEILGLVKNRYNELI